MEIERVNLALATRYRVGEEIGRGGMATVYRGHDLRHDRDVALKILRRDVAEALGAERFLREIRVTARLEHPHILPLLDSGEADGLLYYVMPLIEGESLRSRLAREKQLPLRDALVITREVADALNHAHSLGIVHRDVKPENILLARGHARLADFGIAHVATAVDASRGPPMTATGVVIGTSAYMSPEQSTGERELDGRTDIYSLACVTYEMLAGQPPYSGATVEALVARKLREAAPSVSIVRDAVPAGVDEAMRKALSRVPADRYSTAAEFAEAIERGTETAAASPPGDVATAGPRWRGRRSVPAPADSSRTLATSTRISLALGVLFATAVSAAAFWLWYRDAGARWLRREALPRIEQYLDVADFESAFSLAREIERRVPDSRELDALWPRLSWRVTIPSEPAGARVFRQPYSAPADAWVELGITPLTDIRFPWGLSRLRFELDGYRPVIRALGGAHLNWAELGSHDPDMLLVGPELFKLHTEDALPADMVHVPGFTFSIAQDRLEVRDFFLGRYEVTNAEYKQFVDAGGYRRRELWDPVVLDGRTVPWEQAMRQFVDRTGQPGPGTWEAGDYREGEEALPVSGVSWYEAAAYARFVGRELPTTYHWQRALANSMFPWLLPASNFAGQAPRPVAEGRAMSHVGAFDLTGNVREWTANAIGDERIILGGSWNDPYYIAGTNDASASPADRSPGNGLRLAMTDDEPPVAARLRAPIASRSTVSTTATPAPVSDDVHAAFARVFDYRRGPLGDSVEATEQTRVWIRERVRFDAGYGEERVPLHLYLPTTGSPPYQTVVYWPGWDTFALDDVDEYFAKQIDFIVKRGRAVAFPIYRGTFERQVGNRRSRPAFNTAEYRDNAIETVKELRRTIDYLETRSDINARALAFLGYSWGGVNGPIALAHEPRLRVAVIDIGLLPPMSATPEVDPVNVLPRVRQPTLMLSGEFDHIVPVENARRYFELIGTPPADKRHVIAIGGHFIPRDLLIREVLDWLDRHLGPPGG